MSADGKIADEWRSPARFGSSADRLHLETQIAAADAVLFGAATLRAYGTTLPVTTPHLLQQRRQQGQPDHPPHIVCSLSGHLNPELPFFHQPVPRWLLTGATGNALWQGKPQFERIIVDELPSASLNWTGALRQLKEAGIHRLTVTGGGTLVAALLALNAIDELWLTVCPLLLGGATSPTPVAGAGFSATLAPRLDLLEVRAIAQEVFLHYRVNHPSTAS